VQNEHLQELRNSMKTLTFKSCSMNNYKTAPKSSKNGTCKSFRMRSYKTCSCKSFVMRSYKNRGASCGSSRDKCFSFSLRSCAVINPPCWSGAALDKCGPGSRSRGDHSYWATEPQQIALRCPPHVLYVPNNIRCGRAQLISRRGSW
jgi:hypothetical protein